MNKPSMFKLASIFFALSFVAALIADNIPTANAYMTSGISMWFGGISFFLLFAGVASIIPAIVDFYDKTR